MRQKTTPPGEAGFSPEGHSTATEYQKYSTPPWPTSSTALQAWPRCGASAPPIIDPGAGPHAARLMCEHCGKFLKWLPKPQAQWAGQEVRP